MLFRWRERYRIIDFVLSNMANAGITNIGVATESNYSSLMDHIKSGKPWDLDRKNGGLNILPPSLEQMMQGAHQRQYRYACWYT